MISGTVGDTGYVREGVEGLETEHLTTSDYRASSWSKSIQLERLDEHPDRSGGKCGTRVLTKDSEQTTTVSTKKIFSESFVSKRFF